jgi:hypothetical protein
MGNTVGRTCRADAAASFDPAKARAFERAWLATKAALQIVRFSSFAPAARVLSHEAAIAAA